MRIETSQDYSWLELADRLGSLQSGARDAEWGAVARDAQILARELHMRTTQLEQQNRALAEAQAQPEEARARLARLYDLAPVGLVTLTENGRIEELNLTAAGLLGRWRDDLIGKSFAVVAAVEDQAALDEHLAGCIRNRGIQRIELRSRPPNRSGAVVLELTSTPLVEADGRATCMTVFADVTPRQRDRERTHDTFMNAPVPVFVYREPGYTLVFANRLATPLLTELGPSDRSLDGAEATSRAAVIALLEDTFASGERQTSVGVPFGSGATQRLYDLCAQPVFGQRGRVEEVVVAAVDVTTRLRTFEELARLRDAAENASRMKDDFLGLISHELRTPLNAILGWSHTLTKRASDAAMLQRGLVVMRRNAEALARLVEDMLDVSRIISGKLRVELQSVDWAAIVSDVVDGFRPAAESKGVALELSIGPDTEVIGDSGRVQQVVANLLSNAIKFTPAGGNVQVILRRRGGMVRLTVADTGRGIPADALPRVFDRLRQFDTSTARANTGLGLGLTIVQHIVQAHGGNVAAASEGFNRGATFTVDLRRKRPSMPPPAPRSTSANVVAAGSSRSVSLDPPSLHGISVLVVDDDPDALEVTSVVLGQYGADVRSVQSADEALALLADFTPDVLVSDLAMPGKDGYAFISEVRALDCPAAHVPAIALSAQARSEDVKRTIGQGYQQHISKPADPEELAEAVAAFVGHVT
jgi:PAS domain S-box-containing protein